MVVFVLLLVAQAQADITIFDSNTTISSGDVYDTVVIKGDDTVVDMTGGDVNMVIAMNSSTFNMSGGNIMGETSYGVISYDSSELNFSGGNVQLMCCCNESKVNIYGTVAFTGACYFYDSTIVTVASVNVNITTELQLYGNSTLNLLAGSVGYIYVDSSSKLNITGGIVSSMFCKGRINIVDGTITNLQPYGAEIQISGGSINTIGDAGLGEISAKEIRIIGYDLSAVPYGGYYGTGEITGFWNNGVSFLINLLGDNISPYRYIVLYDGIIPAECTDRPESDTSGDCKVSFTDFTTMAAEWLNCGLEPEEACWE